MRTIEESIRAVREPDSEAMDEARRLQDALTKPRGSLGKLETLSVRLAGAYRTPKPAIGRKVVFTMAGDHGVTAEGVSAYPSEVTAQMVLNFARGGAAINVLSRHAGAEVKVVDMGVASDMDWPEQVVRRKVAKGTRNMAIGPAMTRDEAEKALGIGAELAVEAIGRGANAIAIGDMGIGNTTPASAITSVITGASVAEVTGTGTGIDSSSLENKVRVIQKAININSPDPDNGFDVLAKVGGLEIAGMTGVIIGASSKSVPVFLDGFVSGSAALVADKMCPKCRGYMIASHMSVEPGHRHALGYLKLEPVLDLGMRLGEGTGAVLAFMIAEAACKILNEMATFEGASVSRSKGEGRI